MQRWCLNGASNVGAWWAWWWPSCFGCKWIKMDLYGSGRNVLNLFYSSLKQLKMISTIILILWVNNIVIEVCMGRLILYCKTNSGMDNCDGLGDCSDCWELWLKPKPTYLRLSLPLEKTVRMKLLWSLQMRWWEVRGFEPHVPFLLMTNGCGMALMQLN